jgi:regulator of replication initiation timing
MDIKILNKFNSKYTEFKDEVDSYIRKNALLISENEKLKIDLEKLEEEKNSYKNMTNSVYMELKEIMSQKRENKGSRKNIRRRKPKSRKPKSKKR